jgi:hypothetical protein
VRSGLLKDNTYQTFGGAADPGIAALGYANVDYDVGRGTYPPSARLS